MLTDNELAHAIDVLTNDLQYQMNLASAADRRVAHHRNRIKRYCESRNYSEDSMRAKFKIDYDFNDALDDYRYRCSEVARISAAIQGIVAGHTWWYNHRQATNEK